MDFLYSAWAGLVNGIKNRLFCDGALKLDTRWKISIFVIVCLFFNYCGKYISEKLQLPLWLDSFGTIAVAYALGPVCGAIVGLASNLPYSINNAEAAGYSLVSMSIGIIVGIAAKRDFFENVFRGMLVCSVVTAVSIVISVPLNILIYDGYTGNIWGDGVIDFLLKNNCPSFVAFTIGEFYLDFLDKTLLVTIFHYMILSSRRSRKRGLKNIKKSFIVSLLLPAILFSSMSYMADAAGGLPYLRHSRMSQTIFNSSNGLQSNEAMAIAQTKDGSLWIGTRDGIYRYDGASFTWMKDFSTVKNVNCLYVDEEGRMLIGTNDMGLSVCINQRITATLNKDNGLNSNSVTSVVQDAKGEYYIGSKAGICIIDLSSVISEKDVLKEISSVKSLAADENGNVAAVTQEGDLFILKNRRIVLRQPGGVGGGFTCCAFNKDGVLYVGTKGNELVKYEIKGSALEQQQILSCGAINNITSINFTEYEAYVCGDNGVAYIDSKDVAHPIRINSFDRGINNVLVDYQGNIWVSSARLGLLRLSESPFADISPMIGIPQQMVYFTENYKGKLYIGSETGLSIADDSTYERTENALTQSLAGKPVQDAAFDKNGGIWVATKNNGVYSYDASGQLKVYDSGNILKDDTVICVLPLSDGQVAVSGPSGVSFIKDGQLNGFISRAELGNAVISTMVEKEHGRIIAGTLGNGLFVFTNNKIGRHFDKAGSITLENIRRIKKDTKGSGYYLITGNSLCYMSPNNTIEELEKLPYYNNFDLVDGKDDNVFLISSSKLYILSREKLLARKEQNVDGLSSHNGMPFNLTINGVNSVDRKGNLFLSGDKGVIKLTMDNYDSMFRFLRIMVRGVSLDNHYKVQNNDRYINVPKTVNRIEIFPEFMNFTIMEPFVSYYLEGEEKERVVVRQRDLKSIVYNNLPAGEHRLHLEVLDNSNQKAISSTIYTINKEKQMYDYLWFQAYMIIVMLLAVAWITWAGARFRVERIVAKQEAKLAMAQKQIDMANQAIQAIARTVDARDEYTNQHSMRVAKYSQLLGERLGLSEQDCSDLHKAALLHDIGKIGVRDSILYKGSRLTDEEYARMKSHVTMGAIILKDFTLVDHIIEGVLYHHERYDGKGYIHGLKGEEIPLFARIISVADSFDAMTSSRVYREKQDKEYVIGELENNKGTQFDGEIAEAMLQLIREKVIDMDNLGIFDKQKM